MKKTNKQKKFENWIFNNFKDAEKYNKINYYLLRIRKIFLENVVGFDNLSFEIQKDLIITAYMMSIGSKRGTIHDISIFRIRRGEPDETIKKYDIEYGYQEPSYIQVFDKDKNEVILIENL